MADNTTASLDKLTCTDYVDFGKSSDRFGRFFSTKNDCTYLDIKLKVFKREDKNAQFRQRQNLSMEEADFNQFIRQRNQLVVAADNFLREQNLFPVLQSALSKDMEEQLKLVHKVIDLWIAQTEGFVWPCWDTSWKIQKHPMLKFVFSAEEGGRKDSTNCVCQL